MKRVLLGGFFISWGLSGQTESVQSQPAATKQVSSISRSSQAADEIISSNEQAARDVSITSITFTKQLADGRWASISRSIPDDVYSGSLKSTSGRITLTADDAQRVFEEFDAPATIDTTGVDDESFSNL